MLKLPKIVLFDWNDTLVNNLNIPLPGAIEFINILYEDGVILGVVSNKPQSSLENIILKLGLNKFFTAIVGAGKAFEIKPSGLHAKQAISEIINITELNLKNFDECWLVGDSSHDVSCALNAGCIPILIADFVSTNNQYVIEKDLLSLMNIYINLKCITV